MDAFFHSLFQHQTFSISQMAGAYCDEGQNYKNIVNYMYAFSEWSQHYCNNQHQFHYENGLSMQVLQSLSHQFLDAQSQRSNQLQDHYFL